MYPPTVGHAVAITVVPGPDVAPQISYHIRDMIARVLRESPLPRRSTDVHVTITHDSAHSARCFTEADVDIDRVPIHVEANGGTAREAVGILETRLRTDLATVQPSWP